MRTVLANIIFYLSILIFIIAFNFTDNPMPSGWYQQFMPDLNNEPISDITFLDSLIGFAVTGDGNPYDSNYILKTTNGGDNWQIKFTAFRDFFRIQFINVNTGFTCGGLNSIGQGLFKTTNSGENWFQVNAPSIIRISDMNVLNEDTIWVVDYNSLEGGVFRTTNGGASWTGQYYAGANNPDHIYMYNRNIGFINSTNIGLQKTTNSGINWFSVGGNSYFFDMYFVDSLTGWRCNQNMLKTTDGGFNWITQTLPYGGNIILSHMLKFSNINRDTIWGVGGYVFIPGTGIKGMIYKTTNSGDNWLFQIPDTSIILGRYYYNEFVNKLNGWAYAVNTGVHTVTGGDTTWYFGIQQTGTEVPEEFVLGQNYPNPFNPRTVIPFSLKKRARVRLIAYDIRGREVQRMVDSELSAGEYEVDFMGKFVSSGVYLYRLEVSDDRSKQLFTQTRKMILLK